MVAPEWIAGVRASEKYKRRTAAAANALRGGKKFHFARFLRNPPKPLWMRLLWLHYLRGSYNLNT